MQHSSYIGVTDFENRHDVNTVSALIPPSSTHKLHVGAMMSYKSLHGIPSRVGWENIWLNAEGLRALFANDNRVLNTLHWADYDNLTQVGDLIQAASLCGEYLHAMQLDMVWPEIELIEQLKTARPELKIILQVSHKAMEQIPSTQTLQSMLARYEQSVDYILLDWGMGRGEAFEPQQALSVVEAALEVFEEPRIAVAGGLGPQTYTNLREILTKYPLISCDAQGRLRTSGSATEKLEMERVKGYVGGVVQLLEEVKVKKPKI